MFPRSETSPFGRTVPLQVEIGLSSSLPQEDSRDLPPPDSIIGPIPGFWNFCRVHHSLNSNFLSFASPSSIPARSRSIKTTDPSFPTRTTVDNLVPYALPSPVDSGASEDGPASTFG